MLIITNRPIQQTTSENINNDEYSECCGMSNFDDDISEFSTNLEDYSESLGDDMDFSFADGKMKQAFSKFKPDEAKRQKRQQNRQTRRSEKKKARDDKKPKKNAKKLGFFKRKDGSEGYLFPISKLFAGKKKYKDGKEEVVSDEDRLKITTSKGESLEVDKEEIANVLQVDKKDVTQEMAQSRITIVPETIVNQQSLNKEVLQSPQETLIAVEVPDENVTSTFDGDLYLNKNVQDVNEKEKDVADEEKESRGLTKTQKIVVYSVIGVGAIILVTYFISRTLNKK